MTSEINAAIRRIIDKTADDIRNAVIDILVKHAEENLERYVDDVDAAEALMSAIHEVEITVQSDDDYTADTQSREDDKRRIRDLGMSVMGITARANGLDDELARMRNETDNMRYELVAANDSAMVWKDIAGGYATDVAVLKAAVRMAEMKRDVPPQKKTDLRQFHVHFKHDDEELHTVAVLDGLFEFCGSYDNDAVHQVVCGHECTGVFEIINCEPIGD